MAFDLDTWVRESEEKYKEIFESVTLEMEEVPAGEYLVKVESAIAKESKSGREMVEWKFRVIDGKYKNRVVFKHSIIDGEEGVKRFGKDLLHAGVKELNWFSWKEELKNLLDKDFKVDVKINVKDGNTYRNVYFVKPLDPFSVSADLPF